MYNLAKKYLLLGLSLSLLIVAATFFFNQKETTDQQIKVATKKPIKLIPIDYEGHIVLDEADTVTAGTVDLAAMAQSITEEALKAFSGSNEHSLPLLSHWNVGIPELTDAMNPMYMIDRIEQGEHVLVSWKLDPYYADTIGSSYYEESIKKAAELQLPLVFILPAPESALIKDSYYKNLPKEENPNVVDQSDNILSKLSPFGPDERWSEVGNQWSSTTLMENLQIWYPNPPLVIFISEDEADKLSWSELTNSSRFSQQYPTDQDDNFKRILVGAKWIEKYRQLQNGFKEGLTESAWKNNAKFISYNKLSDNFGKSTDWIDNATVTNQYINVWPLTTDGVTVDFDLTESKSDATANAPHVLANNLEFMLKEAKRANSNFAYQLSINDDSKITDVTRYRGLTQFSLWFLRPDIIRQKASATTRTELEPMFKEIVDSVELIHYNSQIAEFWKNGKIVSNGESYLNVSIPEQYKDDPRWFLLDADINPQKPWSDSTNINVWTFAIVKGEAPNREWLIYAQSPEASLNSVTINIPTYEDVLVDSNQDGNFYILSENASQANIVQTSIAPTINTENQNITAGARPVASTPLENATKFASPNGNGDGTIENPYNIADAFNSLAAGDVLFLRGGTYDIPLTGITINTKIGTKESPIIIESYPGEVAILDGGMKSTQDVINNSGDYNYGVVLYNCEYLYLRKVEITSMWSKGLYLWGSRYCKVQGSEIHHNFTLGIHLLDTAIYTTPYTDGWNEITDCLIHNNSDAGIPADGVHNNGENGDGISVSSGTNNIISYNTVYSCSDDGIDAWKSNNTSITHNIVHTMGIGDGNGNGIKFGGNLDNNPPLNSDNGRGTEAHYNIVYGCNQNAFDQNAGKDNVVTYNTAYNNANKAFAFGADAIISNNISQNNGSHDYNPNAGTRTNNSWQIGDGNVDFISIDSANVNFLIPIEGGLYESIGAYPNSADTPSITNPSLPTDVPIWILGDSTVANYAIGSEFGGWGENLEEELFANPSRVFNRARSGASAKSYKPTTDTSSSEVGLFWGDGSTLNSYGHKGVKQDIVDTNTTSGGYLLIAFGHNDSYIQSDYDPAKDSVPNLGNEWDIEIMEYINHAIANNVTPILVTNSSMMGVYLYQNTFDYRYYTSSLKASTPAPWTDQIGLEGDWPQTIRDMAEREDIVVLDLMTASSEYYKTFANDQEAKDLYSYNQSDMVHTNPTGASMLANLIKDLAAEAGTTGLIEQFK